MGRHLGIDFFMRFGGFGEPSWDATPSQEGAKTGHERPRQAKPRPRQGRPRPSQAKTPRRF